MRKFLAKRIAKFAVRFAYRHNVSVESIIAKARADGAPEIVEVMQKEYDRLRSQR